MRLCVVRLWVSRWKFAKTLCNAALFASKTLSSKFLSINFPTPYGRFARAIFQAITKLASATLLSLLLKVVKVDCCLFQSDIKEGTLSDVNLKFGGYWLKNWGWLVSSSRRKLLPLLFLTVELEITHNAFSLLSIKKKFPYLLLKLLVSCSYFPFLFAFSVVIFLKELKINKDIEKILILRY